MGKGVMTLKQLKEELAKLNKDDFVELVYKQIVADRLNKQRVKALIHEAMMEAFNKKQERDTPTKEFIWACIYAYHEITNGWPTDLKPNEFINFLIDEDAHIRGYKGALSIDGYGDKQMIKSGTVEICLYGTFRKTLKDIQRGDLKRIPFTVAQQ